MSGSSESTGAGMYATEIFGLLSNGKRGRTTGSSGKRIAMVKGLNIQQGVSGPERAISDKKGDVRRLMSWSDEEAHE